MLRRRNWPKNKYTCQPLADLFQTISSLKTVTKSDKSIFAIQALGEDIVVDEITTNIIEKLFCHFYGMQEENEINDARYQTFCKNKILEPHQLLPTKDELS